ncbi:hypothetical protein, partial [Mycobacterium tuberculosis]|uniref:hypothetical protein n=1 Tax=Mycobacterium tuberculosis TaxID=1773 RepID=UPI001B1E8642|nr:hypothetical protein [Mycobacterium tuberculosis]
HEEAQAVVGQQIAVAAAQRQQARAEGAKLASDLTELCAELTYCNLGARGDYVRGQTRLPSP